MLNKYRSHIGRHAWFVFHAVIICLKTYEYSRIMNVLSRQRPKRDEGTRKRENIEERQASGERRRDLIANK